MANKLQAGYGNGGIEPMEQFDKLAEKIGNSLKNLEYTRDMLRLLADTEKKSAQSIIQILNKKNKTLRFSVVDQSIQNYWKKIESSRRHFSQALQEKIVLPLDEYINAARQKRKQLQKENSKIQRSFVDVEKERAKQKIFCEKKWKELEEQINKNDIHKKANKVNKIKDLKPLQKNCSKAFKKMEDLTNTLNDIEQLNHKTACDIGVLLHESQKYAAQRLSIHYNTSVLTKKYLDEFINSNKSIVQSKAPPLNDILWRWLTYPRNHQTRLPCAHQDVLNKTMKGQRFKPRVESDYQQSTYLQKPIIQKEKEKNDNKNNHKKMNKNKKQQRQQQKGQAKTKQEEPIQTKQEQQEQEQQIDDNWDVAFGDNQNDKNNHIPSGGNAMSDADFFGDSGGFGDNDDIFSENSNKKSTEQNTKKDPIEQHNEEIKQSNGFDHGFDDNNDFDFGNNADLNIANENAQDSQKIDTNWDTNFDDNTFALDEKTQQNNTNNNGNIDALFAQSEVDETIFGDNPIQSTENNNKNDDNNAQDFGFGNDDFAASFGDIDNIESVKNKKVNNVVIDFDDDGMLFGDNNDNLNVDIDDDDDDDDEFGGGAIEFPSFDDNFDDINKSKTKTKNNTKKQSQQPKEKNTPQLTSIPVAVISFDAEPSPMPSQEPDDLKGSPENEIVNDDNPFAIDNDDDDDGVDNDHNTDEIDDNPFLMFNDETNNGKDDGDFDDVFGH